jgi:hypothetical protein
MLRLHNALEDFCNEYAVGAEQASQQQEIVAAAYTRKPPTVALRYNHNPTAQPKDIALTTLGEATLLQSSRAGPGRIWMSDMKDKVL